jgi:hypothetical protein
MLLVLEFDSGITKESVSIKLDLVANGGSVFRFFITLFTSAALAVFSSAVCNAEQTELAASENEPVTSSLGHAKAHWLKAPKDPSCEFIRYSPDRAFVANLSGGRLELTELGSETNLWRCPPPGQGSRIWGYSWSPDSKTIAVSNETGVFYIEALTGKCAGVYKGFTGRTYSPAYSPDGKYCAAAGSMAGDNSTRDANTVRVWDVRTGSKVLEVSGQSAGCVRWSNDGKFVAFNGPDRRIQIWNVLEKRMNIAIPFPERAISTFEWSPDDRYLAGCDLGRAVVTIFDSATGNVLTSHKFKKADDFEWTKNSQAILTFSHSDNYRWNLQFKSGRIKESRSEKKTLGQKGYIPKNIDECLLQLNCEMPRADIGKLRACKESDLFQKYDALSMWIEDNWFSSSESELAKFFAAKGYLRRSSKPYAIILSYHRKLNGLSFELPVRQPRAETQEDRELAKVREEQYRCELEAKQKKIEAVYQNIAKSMLGVKLDRPAHLQSIAIPPVVGENLCVRYAAPFEGKILLTTKYCLPNDDFYNPAYLFDLTSNKIHPLSTSEFGRIDGAVVFDSKLYMIGSRHGKQQIVEYSHGRHKLLALPPGEGWLTLGTSSSGLLAVRKNSICQLQGDTWKTIVSTKFDIPKCGLPAQMIGPRIYFRDEGIGESWKRLCWLDLNELDHLIYFEENCGLRDPEGPTYDMVYSFVQGLRGDLWISSGSFSHTLFRWNKEDGYRIATLSDRIAFEAKKLPYVKETDGISERDVAITCVLPDTSGDVFCFGPSGMYRLHEHELSQLVKFTNAVQENWHGKILFHNNWVPTHIVKCGENDYFLGTHWGGTARLQLDQHGAFKFILLDGKLGSTIRL